MTGDRGNRFRLADSEDIPQFALEFQRLCATARCGVPLFRGPKVLSARHPVLCAGLGDRKRRKKLSRAGPRAGAGFSTPGSPRSVQAADRAPLRCPGIARVRQRGGRLLGEPRPAAGDCREKSPERPRAHPGDRRAGRDRARGRAEELRRPHRQALARPDRHAGERLSRTRLERIEPAAPGGPHNLDPRAALRHLSAGGAGVQPGRERLLDLPRRSDDAQPRGQIAARARAGPLRRALGAGPALARTERHRACSARDRESNRRRLPHAIARSHHQPRPAWAQPP